MSDSSTPGADWKAFRRSTDKSLRGWLVIAGLQIAGGLLLSLGFIAGVALAADAVHGHGQRGVGLGGDGAQRHGAGGETLDDFLGRLDLVDRDGLGGVDLEFEQTAQGHVAAALVVDELRVFLVGVPVVGARAVLQLGDGVGRPHVLFAAGAPGVFAAGVEHGGQHRVVAKGRLVHADAFFGESRTRRCRRRGWRCR